VLVVMHEVLHYFVSTSVAFLRCIVTGCVRGTSGRESGGTSALSGITATVHDLVTQSKHAIN
jgi:hypothetical protein